MVVGGVSQTLTLSIRASQGRALLEIKGTNNSQREQGCFVLRLLLRLSFGSLNVIVVLLVAVIPPQVCFKTRPCVRLSSCLGDVAAESERDRAPRRLAAGGMERALKGCCHIAFQLKINA